MWHKCWLLAMILTVVMAFSACSGCQTTDIVESSSEAPVEMVQDHASSEEETEIATVVEVESESVDDGEVIAVTTPSRSESSVSSVVTKPSEETSSETTKEASSPTPAIEDPEIQESEIQEPETIAHQHEYRKTVTVQAECGTDGEATFACACGDSYTEKIPKTGKHKWNDGVVTKAPTTKKEGVKTYTCRVCGTTKTESVSKLKEETVEHIHAYTARITAEATCEKNGVRTYACACGDSYTETIPAIGHNYVVLRTDISCNKTVTFRQCKNCGKEYSETRNVGNGQHTWNVGKTTKAATCKEAGIKTYTCSVCGATKTEAIPKTTAHKWNNGVVTTQPTCTKAGIRTYTCTVCGTTRTESITATGHSYAVVNTTLYCEQTATTFRCSKCSNQFTEVKAGGKGHQWELAGEVPATCVNAGYKSYVCIECYETKEQNFPATGVHREWSKVEKAATCTEDGMRYCQCYDCRAVRHEVIKATGHDFSLQHVTAWPTIFNTGSYTMKCSRCGGLDGSAHTLQKCTFSYNDAEEARFLALVNRERANLGLTKMLEMDATHCYYADEKAKYITVDFSHDAWTIYGRGECIAGQYGSAESVLMAWETSPGHWGTLSKAYDNCARAAIPVGVAFITVHDPNVYMPSCGTALDGNGRRFDGYAWVFNVW